MIDDPDTEREERAIYAIVVAAALPVAVAALWSGPLDGGATLCLGLAAIATLGMSRSRAHRVPPARVVSRLDRPYAGGATSRTPGTW